VHCLPGFVHHGKAAHSVDVQHVYAKLRGLNGCLRYGIGYVVVFEIEENLRFFHLDEIDDLGATVGEKLFSYLEHSHVVLEL